MVKVYVMLIKNGLRTVDSVPANLTAKVIEELITEYNSIKDNELEVMGNKQWIDQIQSYLK